MTASLWLRLYLSSFVAKNLVKLSNFACVWGSTRCIWSMRSSRVAHASKFQCFFSKWNRGWDAVRLYNFEPDGILQASLMTLPLQWNRLQPSESSNQLWTRSHELNEKLGLTISLPKLVVWFLTIYQLSSPWLYKTVKATKELLERNVGEIRPDQKWVWVSVKWYVRHDVRWRLVAFLFNSKSMGVLINHSQVLFLTLPCTGTRSQLCKTDSRAWCYS